MKVLLSGAFGNVGSAIRHVARERDLELVCFDAPTRHHRRTARRSGETVYWGDIRDKTAVFDAVSGVDAVIHLAAIIPPASMRDPELARQVNVGGTANVIAACQAQSPPPTLCFSSSLALFGGTQHLDPPRTLADPIQVTDDYTRHKALCEDLLRASGLDVAILRFGAVLPIKVLQVIDPLMFEVPLSDRMECLHPYDAAAAVLNAVERGNVWGRTLLVGGGPGCQVYARDIIQRPLIALGLGTLPDEAFGTTPFHLDWVDTTDTEARLSFQQRSFDDCIADMVADLGWKRPLLRLARPFARRRLLAASPYYNRKEC